MTTSKKNRGKIFTPYTVVSNKKYYFICAYQILYLFLFVSFTILLIHKIIAGFHQKNWDRFDRLFVIGNIAFFIGSFVDVFHNPWPWRRGHLKIEDRLIFPLSSKEKLIKENKEIDESWAPTYTIFSSKLFKQLVAKKIGLIVLMIFWHCFFTFLCLSLGPKYYPNGFWLIKWFDIVLIISQSLFFLSVGLEDLYPVFKKGYIERDYFKEDFAHVYTSGPKIKNRQKKTEKERTALLK